MCIIRDGWRSGSGRRRRRGGVGRGGGHEFERIGGTEGLDLGQAGLGSGGGLEKVLGDDGDGCWASRDDSCLQVCRRGLEDHSSFCFLLK